VAAGDEPDQLDLALATDEPADRLPRRIRPMVASAGGRPFDDAGYLFEPWWPGTRLIVFVEDGSVRLQAEHLSDPLEAFPELAGIRDLVAGDGLVMDGTLLVIDAEGRPDPEALRRRIASPSDRVGQPGFVAQDLLYADRRPLARRPFSQRRDRLLTLLTETDWCVVGRAYREEGTTVAEALEELGIEAMSARRLDATYATGSAGDAWLRLPLEPAEPVTRPPSLALLQRLPL
jgi:bifunctional non-homologous end joining protein LigD